MMEERVGECLSVPGYGGRLTSVFRRKKKKERKNFLERKRDQAKKKAKKAKERCSCGFPAEFYLE
jgi:hypothetical protein